MIDTTACAPQLGGFWRYLRSGVVWTAAPGCVRFRLRGSRSSLVSLPLCVPRVFCAQEGVAFCWKRARQRRAEVHGCLGPSVTSCFEMQSHRYVRTRKKVFPENTMPPPRGTATLSCLRAYVCVSLSLLLLSGRGSVLPALRSDTGVCPCVRVWEVCVEHVCE